MLALFRAAVPPLVLAFVLATMLNLGFTQRPGAILEHLRNRAFVLKMLLVNFVLAPLVMILLLRVVPLDPALRAGLLVFSLCAGAPFLIKLTQVAEHHVALGAAVMFLLMAVTVPYVPLVLPRVLTGVSVDAWAIVRTLLVQLVLPTAVGMAVARWVPGLARTLQPWAARISGVTLYAVIAATMIGYFPNMLEVVGTGAILLLLVFTAVAIGAGYWAGSGRDHYEDVGALGTAQRNTAAGLIIATQNFGDPNVLVMLTLANTIGIVLLMFVARRLRVDNVAITTAS
jgi:bile acid:Na+ symporter, BASS family